MGVAPMKFSKVLGFATVAAVMAPQIASAHVGLGDAHDALHGFIHPLTGIDHILAMVSVGLLAANLGGRATWAVPVSFVSMMLVGGILGMNGFELPLTELGIGLSVISLGSLIAVSARLPVALAMAMAGVFAIFHGFAHGAEMPVDASGLMFATGFVVATASLHIAGIVLGIGIARLSQSISDKVLKVGGGAVALAGVALVSGMI